MHAHKCMHVHINAYMHARMHVCTHKCKHTRACMHACMHTYMHACTQMHACMHKHTCMHAPNACIHTQMQKHMQVLRIQTCYICIRSTCICVCIFEFMQCGGMYVHMFMCAQVKSSEILYFIILITNKDSGLM